MFRITITLWIPAFAGMTELVLTPMRFTLRRYMSC